MRTKIYPALAPCESISATFELPLEIFDLYPNAAPGDGSNRQFESGAGQIDGRTTVNIMAEFPPQPTLFDAEIYANPATSRNLEFDPAKEIR